LHFLCGLSTSTNQPRRTGVFKLDYLVVCETQRSRDQAHYARVNLTMLADLPNYEFLKFWDAELPYKKWIWGIVPSVFLSQLMMCQQYQPRLISSAVATVDRFVPQWLCWPTDLDIPGLRLMSEQNKEHLQVYALVAEERLFHLQCFFKRARAPPPGSSYYIQSKLQWWWLCKMDGHNFQIYKIKGNARSNGSYWVEKILLIDPSQTHDLVSAVTAVPPNVQNWELPLVLHYTDKTAEHNGSQLHLYHCALVPSLFLHEVESALASPKEKQGYVGRYKN
jgi:hypothetical protein